MTERDAKNWLPWQKIVFDFVTKHDEFLSSETYQSMSDYDQNRFAAIQLKYPRGSGHTTLAALLCGKFDCAVVYSDLVHWQEIEDAFPDDITDTYAISMYTIYYALVAANDRNAPSEMLSSIRDNIAKKKVVVVDHASMLPAGVKDFLFMTARGKIVFLD